MQSGCAWVVQNGEKSEEDNLFAWQWRETGASPLAMSALPSCMQQCPVTCSLAAEEFYPECKCLWKLKKAMYGLRQAPRGNDLEIGIQEMQE